MTIGQLQKMTGVPGHSLRRLAERGLIPAKRPPRGYWRIPESALAEIKKKLEEFGLMESRAKEKGK
jgi:hypothetical protein